MTDNRVLIAGAGPVGMVAAARLVQAGIPVTVFEAGSDLSTQSRASTFHPPTLDMLAELGVADRLIEQGLAAPYVQYRSRSEGLLGRFDFGEIADLTGHPYRLQCEQWRLCRALLEKLGTEPDFEICFDSPVKEMTQDETGVTVTLGEGDAARTRTGRWLIGADGASSVVRQSNGIGFEGFTWAERFLVVTTTADLRALVPDLDTVTYVADPEQWNFFLEIPTAWRVMFPVPNDMSTSSASSTIGMTRSGTNGWRTCLPWRWVYRGSCGWIATAVSPSIVSRRVVATTISSSGLSPSAIL